MKHMNLHNKDVIHIHYDINLACNNRCPYCFKLSRLDNKKLVNLEVFNDVINAVNNLKEEQPNYKLNLHLLGGEPLLTIDETIEFIERTTDKNVGLDVYTNLNFEPDSDNIKKILHFHKTNQFFRLTVSWHLSSNQQLIKYNIKKCENFSIILLLVSDDTMDIVYENFKWLRKNVNSKYCIEEIIVDDISTFTMFDDERYIEMVESSLDSEELDVIDGKEFSYIESRQLLTNISQKYYVSCQLSQLSIDYYGQIGSLCSYPYDGKNIKNGIKIPYVFCNGYDCGCITLTHKNLIREKL